MCVFMHHDVKVENDTIPAEERKRQKAQVEREEGNKEHCISYCGALPRWESLQDTFRVDSCDLGDGTH